jgi:hypothetical protein
VDAESGEVDPAWAPQVGTVPDAIAFTPEHVVVATGTYVDAYDPNSGRPDRAFRLRAGPDDVEDAGVGVFAVSGPHIYIGGRFRKVNGAPRTSLARVDARTGRFDRGWDPPELGTVWGLALGTSSVFAVGDFNKAGRARADAGLAAFDTRSGRVGGFRAPRPGQSGDGYAGSYDVVAVVSQRVFAGGDFGAAPTGSFVTLDPRTGKPLPSPWHPARRHALVQLIVPSGAGALVAGDKLAPPRRPPAVTPRDV